ncbi:MAG: D-alanyl-D-alanine carboxypeptidase [Clostridiales bacterium]|nr:D-alanyl-D-alanine carboxypeptidase [Clostridiales bacterium]
MKKFSSLFLAVLMLYITGVSYVSYAAAGDWNTATANQIYKDTTLDNLQAKSVTLMDFETGRILLSKNGDERYPMASMTKLMTILLLYEAMSQDPDTYNKDTIIRASKNASETEGSKVWLKIGEEFTIDDALKCIFIHSANDVAVAIAEKLAGTEEAFVIKMNEKAQELGMVNTHFVDCTGLTSDDHYSTSNDIALLSRYLIQNYPDALNYSSIRLDYFEDDYRDPFMLLSTNDLIAQKFYPGVDGLKTGFTSAAGYCLTSTIKDPNDPDNGRRVISVVMDEPDVNTRAAESKKLLEYGLDNFEVVNAIKQGTYIKDVSIKNGVSKRVKASAGEDLNILTEKGKSSDFTKSIETDGNIKAPIKKGDKLGEVIYKLDDQEVGRVSVVADEDMAKANGFVLFIRKILSWFGLD